MSSVAVCLWIAFAIVLGLAVVGPRRYFRAVQAPLLRNPAANEPSELGYSWSVTVTWILAAVLVCAAVAVTITAAHQLLEAEVGDVARGAASHLDGWSSDDFISDSPESVVASEPHGNKVRLHKVSSTQVGGGVADVYDLTNAAGDHPWCLTVTTLPGDLSDISRTEYEADASPGAC